MKAAHRIQIGEMAPIFAEAGLAWRTQPGGKHLCIVVVDRHGHEHKLALSGTPRGDLECHKNFARQKAKRLVEELGLAEHRGAHHARRRRRGPGYRGRVLTRFTWEAPDPDKGPMRDPFAALANLFDQQATTSIPGE